MAEKHCKCGGMTRVDSLEDNLTIHSAKSSIADRLDRLETEINMLIMLSTNEDRKFDKPERLQSPTKRQCSFGERSTDHSQTRDTLANSRGRFSYDDPPVKEKREKSVTKDTRHMKDEETKTTTPEECRKRRKEKRESGDRNGKKLRKKKSFCRCKKSEKPEKPPSAPPRPNSAVSPIRQQRKTKKRSLSAGPEYASSTTPMRRKSSDSQLQVRYNSGESRSCPASMRNIRDLCHLVVDLSKHRDFAKAISDEWKNNEMSTRSVATPTSTDAVQERQALQQRFMDICFQTEMEHRRLLEAVMTLPCGAWTDGTDELRGVRESLEQQRTRNEELLKVYDELRNEFAQSGERVRVTLPMPCVCAGTLPKEAGPVVVAPPIDAGMGENVENFKRKIQDHLSEIEDLRLTCAKNAEWACEESSQKSKLLKENRYLQTKMTKNYEREQKQIDQINIMRHALKKVGKNNPKVQKLLSQLHKYDSDQNVDQDNCCCSVTAEPTSKLSEKIIDPERLINELNTVIKVQGIRIKDLVELSSSLVTTDTCECKTSNSPSGEQKRQSLVQAAEVEEARKMVEEMKSRYGRLAKSVRGMREIIQQGQAHLREQSDERASLKNEISSLTNKIEENKCLLCERDQAIKDLNNELNQQKCHLSCAEKELCKEKEFKNELNEELKEIQSERDSLKAVNKRMAADIARQSSIINNLEKNARLQQQETFLQQMALDKEKAQAQSAAQFATDRLMQEMQEHQRESRCFNTVRDELSQLLQEKDDQLRNTIQKIAAMMADPDKMKKSLNVNKCKAVCSVSFEDERVAPIDEAFQNTTELRVAYGVKCNRPDIANDNDDLPSRVLRFFHTLYDDAESLGNYAPDAEVWPINIEQDDAQGTFDESDSMSDYNTPPMFTQLQQIREENEEELEADRK